MNIQNQNRTGPNKGLLVVVAAHIVCCGGILLVVTIGWAGIAALAGIFLDPFVQVGVIVLGGVLAAIVWKRRLGNKAQVTARTDSQGSSPKEAP